MNKAVSDYMREMQRRSAKSRWSGMTAAEKSTAMKALRAKGKRKPKARALRQNAALSEMKTYTIKMKTYTMTVTEEQAEAIGYALMHAIKHNKSRRADGDHHAADLVLRLEAAYRVLDTAPEVVS